MTTRTRWHVYRNGTLAGVYLERLIADQDIAGWSQRDQVLVYRVTEAADVETVYGLPDSPAWPLPPVPAIPVVRTKKAHDEVRGEKQP